MQTGWVDVDGSRYLLGGGGAMKTGWQTVGGSWYLLGGDGAMKVGWQTVGGERYYLDPASGAMQTGWKKLDGLWYCFSDSGIWTGESQSDELVLGSPSMEKEALISRMTQVFSKNAAYPADALSKGGADTIVDFCTQLYEEAVFEGVRPELVFCQVMKETGWLRFGGAVKIEQFNFGGLGATDATGSTSASFSIRAEPLAWA